MNLEVVTPLPSGTRLGEYVINEVVDHDDSSIYYTATAVAQGEDGGNNRGEHPQRVDVREFAPNIITQRAATGMTIEATSTANAAAFASGKQTFIRSARVVSEIADHGAGDASQYLQSNGTAYLITRSDREETLAEFLKRQQKPITTDMLSVCMLRLLKALRAFHDASLVHGNVNPSNVYLNAESVPSLHRFAIRVGVSTQDAHAAADEYGREPYRAPEVRHLGAEATVRSDLYALGATLYHCVAGVAPVGAAQRLAELAKGEADPMMSAMELGQGRYPKNQLQCIDWMLAPLADDRPDSADSVLQVISGFGRLGSRGLPRRNKAVTGDSRLDRPHRRRAWLWPSLAAVVAVVSIVAGLRFLLPWLSPTTPTQATVADGQAPPPRMMTNTAAVAATTVIGQPATTSGDAAPNSSSVIQPVDESDNQDNDSADSDSRFTLSTDAQRITAYREAEKQQQLTDAINRRADEIVKQRLADIESERARETERKRRIAANIVASADTALAAKDLLTAETGALALYRKALREDPQSGEAYGGVVAVAAALVERGREALSDKDIDAADKWASVAASVFPDTKGLGALQSEIIEGRENVESESQLALQRAEAALEQLRAEETRRRQALENALARADAAFKRGEILEPADSGAVAQLKRAMDLSDGTQRVLRGTHKAVAAYARQASDAIAEGNTDEAVGLIARINDIDANHPAVRVLRDHLDDRERLAASHQEREAVLQQQADAARIRAEQAEEALRVAQTASRSADPVQPNPVVATASDRFAAPVDDRLSLPSAVPVPQPAAEEAASTPTATAAPVPRIDSAMLNKAIADYYSGRYESAFDALKVLAENGSARAQFRLAVMYFLGRGAPLDPVTGGNWLSRANAEIRRAAEAGSAWAEADLGQMYEEGWGVPQSYESAVRWYRRAATKGYGGAQNNLGVLYEQGLGVPRDRRQAVAWLRRAASQGDSIARENLATLGVRP